MKNTRFLSVLLLSLPLLSSCQTSTSSTSGVLTSQDYTIVQEEESPLKAEFTSDFVLEYDNDVVFTGEGINVTFDGEPIPISDCFFTFDTTSPLEYVIEVDEPIELSVRDADIDLRVGYIPDDSRTIYLSNSQEIHAKNIKVLSYWVYLLFFLGIGLIFVGVSMFKVYMGKKKNGETKGSKEKKILRSPVPEKNEDPDSSETN